MGIEGLSSSVVIVLAAALWLLYLIPTWLRRREYLATERNAVRLQQTLRIMAETAEVPDQIRVESTARSVAAQEKILQREMQRTQAIARAQDAAAARAAIRQLAESRPVIAASVARSSQASRRLRRSRALSSLVLVAALAAVGVGIGQVVVGGAPVLLVSGAAVSFGAVALLMQIAQVGRTRSQLAQTLQLSHPAEVFESQLPLRQAAPVRTSWTPIPVPKPLYLSRSEVADTAAVDAMAGLRAAAAEAERALRASQEQATPISRPTSTDTAAVNSTAKAASGLENRFARMGLIDVETAAGPNLDEVLRRRRAV